MSWRVVVISSNCKLTYKNNYLIIRNDECNMIHLSEIHTIIIDSTSTTISAFLLSELMKKKIKVIFCDEKRNPQSELIPFYGSHNSSKKIKQQMKWCEHDKALLWTEIAKNKIGNQARILRKMKKPEFELLEGYREQVELKDITNREGHAAKVYFNALFGKKFTRDLNTSINAGLDYGYAILLSTFNKEICKNGYLTQLGIHHRSEFNPYNLSSDLMEPFRVLVDEVVYAYQDQEFDKDYKMRLVDLLNKKVAIGGKKHYLMNAVEVYTKKAFQALEYKDMTLALKFYYEL